MNAAVLVQFDECCPVDSQGQDHVPQRLIEDRSDLVDAERGQRRRERGDEAFELAGFAFSLGLRWRANYELHGQVT
jgi:hypothetical protein